VIVAAAETVVSTSNILSATPLTTVAEVAAAVTTEAAQANTASTAIQTANTQVQEATTAIAAARAAVAAIAPARITAQTELTQANVAINNAQDAVNALAATIGASTNVLANTDDAGVRMNLPFNLRMGNTVYTNVYVGSNATLTFGVNEGGNYYSTPNAPSISIAGYDWTTWSNGSGVTYSTTTNTLTVAWDVRVYPLTTADTQMTQIRFNADVNPVDGAWSADVSVTGPIPNGARFNIRETTNGTITPITDTNSGPGFNGTISQGASFTPIPDPSTASVQAAIDFANAQISTLNATVTNVVSTNAATTTAASRIAPIAIVSANTVNALNIATTDLTNKIEALATVSTAVEKVNTAPTIIELAQITLNAIPAPAPAFAPEPVTTFEPQPPAEEPPTEQPPAEEPPTEQPPAEEPPTEQPPAEEPPTEQPPAEEPPIEEVPVEEAPAPVEEAPAPVEEAPPVVTEDSTPEEIAVAVEALIAAADGEAVTAEAIAEAGLTYEDLPPETPVEVRTDENGNQVIITAEVAAALQVLESPSELIGAIFNNPGQVLLALGSIGADMSPQEREEATKMVVATVIASGAAINAATVAATSAATSAASTAGGTGGTAPKGGGTGGGPAAGNDKPKRTFRRRTK
jgi:hypothetical protein